MIYISLLITLESEHILRLQRHSSPTVWTCLCGGLSNEGVISTSSSQKWKPRDQTGFLMTVMDQVIDVSIRLSMSSATYVIGISVLVLVLVDPLILKKVLTSLSILNFLLLLFVCFGFDLTAIFNFMLLIYLFFFLKFYISNFFAF